MAKVFVVFLPMLIICFLILGLVVYAVYSKMYKKKINEKLERNESTAHVSMLPVQTIGIILFIAGVIIFSVTMITMLTNLTSISDDTNGLQQKMRAEISYLTEEIEMLNEKIDEQNSPFVYLAYSYGEVDSEKNTVDVTIDCVPKTAGEDTDITVTIGSTSVELTRSINGEFSGTKAFPLFDRGNVYAAVTTNGLTNTYEIESNGESMFHNCLPVLMGKFGGFHHTSGNGESTVTIDYSIHNMSEEELTDMTLKTVLNGEVIEEAPFTIGKGVIRKEISAGDGDVIELVASGVDKYGYKHEFSALQSVSGHEYIEKCTIYDRSGNIVYKEER